MANTVLKKVRRKPDNGRSLMNETRPELGKEDKKKFVHV
jgi:hypothetical protein